MKTYGWTLKSLGAALWFLIPVLTLLSQVNVLEAYVLGYATMYGSQLLLEKFFGPKSKPPIQTQTFYGDGWHV